MCAEWRQARSPAAVLFLACLQKEKGRELRTECKQPEKIQQLQEVPVLLQAWPGICVQMQIRNISEIALLRQRQLDIHNSHNQWNLGENHIQVFLCGRVLAAQKSSAGKLISPGKLDFSKSKLLNSAADENLEAVPLLAQLLLSQQRFALQRFHKMQVSVSQHLTQRRLNALKKKWANSGQQALFALGQCGWVRWLRDYILATRVK